jgi:predicted AlkP superfamily pyrophosphatase or phosphodiesterase
MKTGTGLAALAAGLALAAASLSTGALAAPPPAHPKLAVVISVDQFSLDLYRHYRPTYTGGLKRLSDGLAFTGYQSHGATETCPGHSTLLTGEHPSKTGIVANNWYDRQTGSNVYCVTQVGDADQAAKTSALLKVDTLGDWLRAQSPAARVYAVSAKDRAAIMMAGHHPNGVYWWDDGVGFNTSQYAGPADAEARAPAEAFDRALAAQGAKAPALWSADLPAACQALQKPLTIGKVVWSGQIPPDTARSVDAGDSWLNSASFAGELRPSPLIDRLTLDFAEKLLNDKKLGRGEGVDLLAVSLSATDYVGHRYGPGGPEMCANMAALDANLGEFLGQLDATGVPYVVVLTADHGSVDVPERLGPPAQRIDTLKVQRELTAFLKTKLGFDYDPLVGDDPRQLILSLGPADEARRPAVTRAIVDWLNARPEIAHAFTADEIAAAVPPKGKPAQDLTLAERFNESFERTRSGDIIVAWLERASLGVPLGPYDTVAGHGSPWDYDRRVPILFWWSGADPRSPDQPIETVDIAPTLAALLGVKAPADLDGQCIDLGQGCR